MNILEDAARIKLKKPKHRTVRLYTCDGCGKEFQWGEGCAWWPEKLTGRNKHYYDPDPQYYACSVECQEAVRKKHNLLPVREGEWPL
jgi:hypothetical protein